MDGSRPPRLADLTPFLTITVLDSTGADPDTGFAALREFLHRAAEDPGRGVAVEITSETMLGAEDGIEEIGALGEQGFQNLYRVSRVLSRPATWAPRESGVLDVVNQLMIAVRHHRLVAVHSDFVTFRQLKKWILNEGAPFRFLPRDILAATFPGDGKMVWTRGTHRRRSTRPDSKALGGIRIQDALDPIDDSSFALSAAKVDFQPADPRALLRDVLTVSPNESRISWKRPSSFRLFLLAVLEALDRLEEALVATDPPLLPFNRLAVEETDLRRVHGAFEVLVADPDEIRAGPDPDDERAERADLLRDTLIEVHGDPNSATAVVDVGHQGTLAGTLTITPAQSADGSFALEVAVAGTPSQATIVREVKEAIEDDDLLTVYYESGHAFSHHVLTRRNLAPRPFHGIDFEDFGGFVITKEKPNPGAGPAMYDAIGKPGDDSLFGWVVRNYRTGWLLCDDGSGEVADFLHLAADRTLTAIHVKAAGSHKPSRGISVTRFEQVVSQAVKNVGLLENATLIAHLQGRPAAIAWHAGRRIPPAHFIRRLQTRAASHRTMVAILQPHLLKRTHDRARAASAAAHPTRDSHSLMLLDDLLHTARKAVVGACDDLTVIASA